MWTPIGIYEVAVESEQFFIYPENKRTGETFRVNIERTCFHLRHKSRDAVTFKRFRHQGKWKWNDSRGKGSVSEQHVVSEVARMLFNRDEEKAKDWLIAGITGAK